MGRRGRHVRGRGGGHPACGQAKTAVHSSLAARTPCPAEIHHGPHGRPRSLRHMLSTLLLQCLPQCLLLAVAVSTTTSADFPCPPLGSSGHARDPTTFESRSTPARRNATGKFYSALLTAAAITYKTPASAPPCLRDCCRHISQCARSSMALCTPPPRTPSCDLLQTTC